MPELLTAKDVELKIFKKVSFGGYAISDVEEFLNQIAEDLETYALRQNEQQRRVHDLEAEVKRHEAMKDTIKDALILAQQSAKDKEDEAKHQAEQLLAKAEAQVGEIDQKGRRRLEEAENTADEIVAAARAAAAQIIKNAESMKEEAQRRLEGLDTDIAQRMADANDKASDITAAARLEARRLVGKAKHEIEELKRETSRMQGELRHFMRDSGELVSAFAHLLEDANRKMEKGGLSEIEPPSKPETTRMTLSFSPISDDADEVAIS